MFQRDTLFFSQGYSVSDVRRILVDWELYNKPSDFDELVNAVRLRFVRYFEIYDYYFSHRQYIDLSQKHKAFVGVFTLSNDFIVAPGVCSLLETYYQFIEGIDQTPPGETVQAYIQIFKVLLHRNPCYSEENAKKFYKLIRNGIIHQAKTSITAAFSDGGNPIFVDGDGFLLCNLKSFYGDLSDSIHNYFNYLSGKSIEVKAKFIAKIRAILS